MNVELWRQSQAAAVAIVVSLIISVVTKLPDVLSGWQSVVLTFVSIAAAIAFWFFAQRQIDRNAAKMAAEAAPSELALTLLAKLASSEKSAIQIRSDRSHADFVTVSIGDAWHKYGYWPCTQRPEPEERRLSREQAIEAFWELAHTKLITPDQEHPGMWILTPEGRVLGLKQPHRDDSRWTKPPIAFTAPLPKTQPTPPAR